MSEIVPLSADHRRRLAEASAWRVTLSEEGLFTSQDFERWLAQPANEEAWDEVQASWGLVGDHANGPELLALRQGALARARRSGAERWTKKPGVARIAAMLLLALTAGLLWLLAPGGHQPTIYATTLGERRVVTLGDGSKLSLDSASEVSVDYSADARRLILTRGQARFDVAHDVTRPFSVRARDRIVVATGTAFNVDLIGRKVQVTLIEGRVTILSAPAEGAPSAQRPARGIELVAGQQFRERGAAAVKVEPVNLERATSWETGQLVFEDEPLGSIVERVSRYSKQQLTADPSVAALRISGVFNTGDVATFVDTVERYLPVKSVPQADGRLRLERAR